MKSFLFLFVASFAVGVFLAHQYAANDSSVTKLFVSEATEAEDDDSGFVRFLDILRAPGRSWNPVPKYIMNVEHGDDEKESDADQESCDPVVEEEEEQEEQEEEAPSKEELLEGESFFAYHHERNMPGPSKSYYRLRKHGWPLVGKTIDSILFDTTSRRFALQCKNATHKATFSAQMDTHNTVRKTDCTEQDITKEWNLEDSVDYSQVESVKQAIGATVHGVYLGAGKFTKFKLGTEVVGWNKVHIDLGNRGWLSIAITIGFTPGKYAEVTFDHHWSDLTDYPILHCTDVMSLNIRTFEEKKRSIGPLLEPLRGKTVQSIEPLWAFDGEKAVERRFQYPVRLACTDGTSFIFAWAVSGNFLIADLRRPGMEPMSRGYTTYEALKPYLESVSNKKVRWMALVPVGKMIVGTSMSPTAIRFELEDGRFIELFYRIGETGVQILDIV